MGARGLGVIGHPVFVPWGEDRLAAYLTLPEDEPRAIWLLVPGQGAPRGTQFHFPFLAEIAGSLACRGIASIRMDFRGMGDSSGRLEVLDRVDVLTEQSIAVARFGLDVTGLPFLGFIGNCGGGRAAVEAARRIPESIAVVVAHMAPRIDPAAQSSGRMLRHRIRSQPAVRRALETSFARKVVKPAAGAVLGERRGLRATGREMEPALADLLARTSVLFVSGDDEAKYWERLKPFLDRFMPTLSPELAPRLESRLVETAAVGGYRSVPGQLMVAEILVEAAVRATAEARTQAHLASGD